LNKGVEQQLKEVETEVYAMEQGCLIFYGASTLILLIAGDDDLSNNKQKQGWIILNASSCTVTAL